MRIAMPEREPPGRKTPLGVQSPAKITTWFRDLGWNDPAKATCPPCTYSRVAITADLVPRSKTGSTQRLKQKGPE